MENNDVQSQLDSLEGFLEGLGGGKSTESGGINLNEFINQIKGSMLEQLKSLYNENVTQENLDSVVQTIKSTYNDDQESIKTGLGNVLSFVKSFDTTGKLTGYIECLQNDIDDRKCSEEILGASTSDQSQSMAFVTKGPNLFVLIFGATVLMFFIHMISGRRH